MSLMSLEKWPMVRINFKFRNKNVMQRRKNRNFFNVQAPDEDNFNVYRYYQVKIKLAKLLSRTVILNISPGVPLMAAQSFEGAPGVNLVFGRGAALQGFTGKKNITTCKILPAILTI